ncbi:cell envelope integrity protein TolA [Allosphingosinicella deserti]|uniref:TonB C-terminal domain-containing protein n=1 Tax=Allosphingosinicella deserti TaxID=2116704 RepID=A0A2P7QHX5_9SPHN|nr:cell envelope integrity protein TolA [Sphingomonas deserti]PSJ37578.1 hypothetical protein C7I55_21095 [Sphingomonas deserti]
MPCRAILCRLGWLAGPALLFVGCSAPAPAPSPPQAAAAGLDPGDVERAIATAARQVRRCYRAPRIGSLGRSIVTRLRVRYAADGSLIGLPLLVSQSGITPANQIFAPHMARAATEAVIRCSPITLPSTLHDGGWSEIDLTFGPRALA